MNSTQDNNKDFSIILFLCNWGPHAAYQALQESNSQIPAEVKMVRIPCTGRISKALLLKPFEMGADGIALVGCASGACHYGTGTETAKKNVEDTRGILELLGLRDDRLRWATFIPGDSEKFQQFLETFLDEVKQIGKSPVVSDGNKKLPAENEVQIRHIVAAHDVYACQDCGKCSSACSLTLAGKPFSPRALAGDVISGNLDTPLVDSDVWSCLTCGLCYDRCPSAVNFPEFVRDLRHILKERGTKGRESHGGFFHSLMRTMTSKDLKTRHWNWLPDDIRTDSDSKLAFFGGCAPYFDIFFQKHLGVETSKILVDSLRLLNFFDIFPALLKEERCCGHDLLWTGDKDNFVKLARLNVEAMHDLGIEEVITACPECYRTLKRDYPEQGVEHHFKVTHLYELLEKEIDKGAVNFRALKERITFQDPCRLSRFENRADLPRKLISRLKPKAFQEMRDSGSNAICCGNSAWSGCDAFSKALQVKRLRQAHETESDVVVTACPKCQIHLRCAMEDPFFGKDLKMEIKDLTEVLAKTIQWE